MNRVPRPSATRPDDAQRHGSPSQLDDWIDLATHHHDAGRFAEAEAAYRKILEIKPDFAEAHNNLGNALSDQGKLALAEACYERAMDLKPDYAEAHNNLGNALKDQGKLERAVACYEQALAFRADYAEVHNNLGNALRQLGKLELAAARYQQAIALKPTFAVAHNNLGNVLKDQGKLAEAAARYRQALALNPNYAEAYNNLGNALKAQGKLDQALASYAQALALRPDFAEAHYNLGNALKEQGKLDRAIAHYQQAVAVRPDFAEAHNNLGNALTDQGKLGEAVARFQRALELRPDFAEAHNNLGNALKEQGKFELAVAQFERAIAMRLEFAELHNNFGNVLKDQGKFELAMAQFDRALALQPGFTEAHYNRADLKTFRTGDADLATLETLAASKHRLPESEMPCIHFALGKALEDIGDHARAFQQWLAGNALKRRQIDFDESLYQRSFRQIPAAFDASLFDRFASAGDPSPAPIFVLGMPRSGSTLIDQLLASHPQVHSAGELKNLGLVANAVLGSDGPVPYPAYIRALGPDGWRRLGHAYLASLPTLPDGMTRIIDKTPTNFAYIGLIRLILPGARIIHTVRDPVDTCLSCFSRLFTSGQNFSYDLAELGRYYRWYSELMAYWRSILPPGAMLDVSYEDVVDDLEGQARRLIDYCGLSWDDRCLSFHKTSRPITTASNVQVRRPLYRSSVARWRRYETYLQPLLAELEPCRP